MFNSEIEDLCRGSHDENRIFTKVFFGKDTVATSRRSLVSGLVNFQCEDGKFADMSLGSNSENSAVTSQSSTKSSLVEDSDMNDNSGGASASGCFQERLERDDQITSIKRMKLSVDGPSSTGPDTVEVFTSSVLPKEGVNGVLTADRDSSEQTIALYIVESSSHGSISSCYLPKQQAKLDRGNHVLDRDVSKCMAVNTDESAGKEVIICRTVASPVSQESFATKILLTNPSVAITEKSGSILAEESLKELDSTGLDVSNTLKMDFKKDPRPFLQSLAFRILVAMGWRIERIKRPCRKYVETIFLSPGGRLFREFHKVWRLCGQILYADRYYLVQEDNDKEWTDISQFWFDLSDVLMNIEKRIDQTDPANDLAHQWSLLDPFVNAVLIERKVRQLRKGGSVKAGRSIVMSKNDKNDTVTVLTSEDDITNQSVHRNLLTWHGDSSLAFRSASTICEGSHQQSGDRSFSEYDELTKESVEVQKIETIHLAEKEGMCLVGVADGMENQSCRMCKDKASCLNMSSSPPCASETDCAQLCGCHCNDSVADGTVNVLGRFESDSPHQDSSLVDVDEGTGHRNFSYVQDELVSTPSVTLDASQQAELCAKDGQWIQASRFEMKDKTVFLKKKMRRKSRKISEIRSTATYQNENVDNHGNQFEVPENFAANAGTKKIGKKALLSDSCLHDSGGPKLKKMCHNGCKNSQKRPSKCLINDDDLLVSAIIKNKDFSIGASKAAYETVFKLRGRKKPKNQKGSCRLVPRNLSKVGKHYPVGKSIMGPRTVLSWLVDIGVIFLNDVIQYRNPKDDAVIKGGLITKDGIKCRCCNQVLSVSKFRSHAGFKLNRPCLDLFMESGKPFTLCQLQAWSSEYKTRKRRRLVVRADDDDENDDSCGLCGDVGELICCDNCPSTFHPACLYAEGIPEGSWYCPNCTCWICGELVNDKEASSSFGAYKCSQCEHKYHDTCWKRKNICEGVGSDTCFCSGSCQEVYSSLNSRVGSSNHIADGFCWTVLKCIHEDQKVHSAQRFALKAECNSKLAVALTIMEECFQSMVDPRTGIDMIPHVLYNWGSEFARLNFHGFYTAVLEKDDVLLSVASIRIHGATVAEMPLIATCSSYRRQGMCRRLITAIEEMLISLKVEKLVISAIPDLVETWTEGFGFTPLSNDEKRCLSKINLMVFPGAVWLKKTLHHTNEAFIQWELGENAHLIEVGDLATESLQQSNRNCHSDEFGDEMKAELVESQNLQELKVIAETEIARWS